MHNSNNTCHSNMCRACACLGRCHQELYLINPVMHPEEHMLPKTQTLPPA